MRTILAGAFALALSLPSFSAAATLAECQKISPLHRPATMADLVVKNGTIPVGTCYNPAQAGVSTDELEAKQYLKSLPKQWAGGSTYDCKTYEDKNIDKLNGRFAMCMAKFLKAYTAQYGPKSVRITSAYRSHDEQVCVCKGEKGLCGKALPEDENGIPIGGSGVGHQFGTAMDIHPNNGDYAGFHKFAAPFGVWFRLGMADKPHVEPKTDECGLNGAAPPGQYQTALPSGSTSYTPPSSGFADILRSALGLQTVTQALRPTQVQPYAQTQPVLNTFTMPTQVTPTTVVTPTTGTGATAVTPASGGTTGATTGTGGVSDKLFTDAGKTTATGSPLADKLNELAFGVSAGSATSGIPFIPLAINPNDRSDRATTSTSIAQILATKTPSITTDTTFFGGNPDPFQAPGATVSTNSFMQILASIRVTLLNLLARLRPFSSQPVPEY